MSNFLRSGVGRPILITTGCNKTWRKAVQFGTLGISLRPCRCRSLWVLAHQKVLGLTLSQARCPIREFVLWGSQVFRLPSHQPPHSPAFAHGVFPDSVGASRMLLRDRPPVTWPPRGGRS